MMKLKCIACEALARMVYRCAADSPHIIDIEMLKLALHNDPDDLRERLQARIDAVDADEYDAVVMAYALCGKSTHDLTARDLPIVLPRAHDCIALFLGSRDRYLHEFGENPGTYWYTSDYIQRRDSAGTTLSLGAQDLGLNQTYEEYVEKYGEDNADYLMEVMGGWGQHYNRAVFIDTGVGGGEDVEARTREEAARRGWTFERMAGDIVRIRRLLHGDWDDADFLTIQPGERIVMTNDLGVVRAEA